MRNSECGIVVALRAVDGCLQALSAEGTVTHSAEFRIRKAGFGIVAALRAGDGCLQARSAEETVNHSAECGLGKRNTE